MNFEGIKPNNRNMNAASNILHTETRYSRSEKNKKESTTKKSFGCNLCAMQQILL